MKGRTVRKNCMVVVTAAILAFTGVSAVNPHTVYGQDQEKSITITGNITEILNGSNDVQNQENHWSMQIDNQTGKDIMFYDLKKGDSVISKKKAFQGNTLVLDLDDYSGSSVYTVDVYGIDNKVRASAKLYQVQANLQGADGR